VPNHFIVGWMGISVIVAIDIVDIFIVAILPIRDNGKFIKCF